MAQPPLPPSINFQDNIAVKSSVQMSIGDKIEHVTFLTSRKSPIIKKIIKNHIRQSVYSATEIIFNYDVIRLQKREILMSYDFHATSLTEFHLRKRNAPLQ